MMNPHVCFFFKLYHIRLYWGLLSFVGILVFSLVDSYACLMPFWISWSIYHILISLQNPSLFFWFFKLSVLLTYRNSEFSTLSTVTWHLCCLLGWIGLLHSFFKNPYTLHKASIIAITASSFLKAWKLSKPTIWNFDT